MKEDIELRISEFLDGELASAEVDQLLNDCRSEQYQQTILRYQKIGHAMRAETAAYHSRDISQSVAAVIANLADEPVAAASSDRAAKTGWLQDILTGAWLKPALGVAFASSVAVLTIFVNQQQTDSASGAGSTPVLAEQGAFTPVTIELSRFERQSDDTGNEAVAVREQLNNYLVSHARSASGTNYQGMVPYVRVVAYEPVRGK